LNRKKTFYRKSADFKTGDLVTGLESLPWGKKGGEGKTRWEGETLPAAGRRNVEKITEKKISGKFLRLRHGQSVYKTHGGLSARRSFNDVLGHRQ